MTIYFTIHDPAMFSVWAQVDPNHILRAAEHLVSLGGMTIPQWYQMAKHAAEDQRKITVWINVWYSEALNLVDELPLGFIHGSAVIVQDDADLASNYCADHRCFYRRSCGVCADEHLPR